MDERPLTEALEALEADLARKRTIGTQLKAARVAAGWSQTRMANELDVSQAYVSQVESGRRTPSSPDSLSRYYNALKRAEGELHGNLNKQGRAEEDVRKARG